MMSTPTGIFSQPASLMRDAISLAWRAISPNAGLTVPRNPMAGLAVLRREPRRVELVMDGGRAEIPQDRLAGAGEQRPAAELVALPLADLGRGDVADVVDVEHEQRAEVGFLQRLLDACEPIAVQPPIVDALLEIDPHGAERRQRAAPVVARIDILGAELQRLARDVHLDRLGEFAVRLVAIEHGAVHGEIGRIDLQDQSGLVDRLVFLLHLARDHLETRLGSGNRH